jgi:tRNA-2-methylthio-N6-dimethylallyladenosine synthase
MNRGYSRDNYLDLVEDIRREIKGIVLTTDVIVGFPGETDEEFDDTIDLLNAVGFDSAFTFMYSPRPGTPAATMEGQIPLKEKKARLGAVMDAQAASSHEQHQLLLGKELRVLAEAHNGQVLSGRGEGNQLINFPGDARDVGVFHQVRVTEAHTWMLKGEAVEAPVAKGYGRGRI